MSSASNEGERLKRLHADLRAGRPRRTSPAGMVPSPHGILVAEVVDNSGDTLEVDVQAVTGVPDAAQFADTDPKLTRDVPVIGGSPADFDVGDRILIWRRGAYYLTNRAFIGDGTSIDFDQDDRLATQGVTDTIDLTTAISLTVANGLITGYS